MDRIVEKNISRAEAVEDALREYIISNGLKPGDKLPNEFELIAVLNVGRSSVREGVKALVSKNILEIRRGAGTFVSEKQGVSDDPMGLMLFEDKHQLAMDLLEVRMLIEPSIAASAARNATKDDIDKLTILCQEVDDMIAIGEDHLERDVAYHTAIAEASGNLAMPRLIPMIHQSVYIFGNINQLSLKKETVETHNELLEAIRNHDAQSAYDAMYMHLLYNKRSVRKEYKNYNDQNSNQINGNNSKSSDQSRNKYINR